MTLQDSRVPSPALHQSKKKRHMDRGAGSGEISKAMSTRAPQQIGRCFMKTGMKVYRQRLREVSLLI